MISLNLNQVGIDPFDRSGDGIIVVADHLSVEDMRFCDWYKHLKFIFFT